MIDPIPSGRAAKAGPAAVDISAPFDITAPLPRGTTVLEASAGTGKTWAIAALVARHVADGLPLDQLLVVTFGRAATEELRERVRERLIRAERLLRDALTGQARPEHLDRLERTLLGEFDPVDTNVLQGRHRRIRDALGAFDDATIATIHQFCHQVLHSLGVAGDTDPDTTLIEDQTDLLHDVVDDLYLARYRAVEVVPFTHAEAREIAELVAGDPAAEIGPDSPPPESYDEERVRFAKAVRAELTTRKRRLGLLSYDDLLADLAHALADPSAPARARMRARWRVVLVDEFQDTDPVQWQVFERAFHGHCDLVLIGDPKQAIYAFRGGDIDTYLRARHVADQLFTLDVNRRTDAPLVDALGVGLGGMSLGNPEVVVHPVTASHRTSRLAGLPTPHPWRMRVLDRAALGVGPGDLGRVDTARPTIAADCAADIATTLSSGASFDGRPIAPGDVAVLCATNAQLRAVRKALARIGIPAVLAGDESVFRSPAAHWWLRVLQAMEFTNRAERVRSAALTPFFGESITTLDARGDEVTDSVAATLRRWAELFALRGIPAVLAAAQSAGLGTRLLAQPGGERDYTDVHHLAEILHDTATREQSGFSALTAWLTSHVAGSGGQMSAERSRRLESDAAAVQLATVHGSKGLQFPIVYAPFLCDRFVRGFEDDRRAIGLRYHDDTGTRVVDVSTSPDLATFTRARTEDDGENLRLLYVALTRAQSQLVTWWAPLTTTRASSLHRAMFGRGPGGVGTPEAECAVPSDRMAHDTFTQWSQRGGPHLERLDPTQEPPPVATILDVTPALASAFARSVDPHWRRTSYTALTKAADAAAAAGSSRPVIEPELPGKDDESPAAELLPRTDHRPEPLANPGTGGSGSEFEDPPDRETDRGTEHGPERTATAMPSPMAGLPVGATFGSLVHAVLETADPEAVDLRAEFGRCIAEQLPKWPVDLPTAELADALVAVVTTPLGPLAPGATLTAIPKRDRLCELEFEVPLDGGDARARATGGGAPGETGPRASDGPDVLLGDLAPLLRAHLPAGDPLLDYADALADEELGGQLLRGYLTGSVDVVLRLGERYLVVDYKTNWLGAPDIELTAADYGPAALVAAMQHSSYPLQALLYAVVLHRFLRWRLAAYDPEINLGGVLYLYLRGMCGPKTPIIDGSPTGVFSWRPPVALVEAISGLLDGRRP